MAANDLIPLDRLAIATAAMAGAVLVWWSRERRMSAQRRALRALHALAEEIISASSAGQIVERLTAALPAILRVTGVRVYLADRAERALNLAGSAPDEPRVSIPMDSGPDSGVTLCFRNRALVAIPDARRSPVRATPGGGAVRAMLFVPMLRKGEVAGVIEVTHAGRRRAFSPDERAVAQHLANQVAAALGLLEQQSLRERMFRSEKLAASGQLISGVANELRAPLEAVSDLAARLLDRPGGAACEGEVGLIAREARRAEEILDRLVSFSRADVGLPRPLDVVELLHNLIEFRERERAARGILLRSLLPDRPAHVLGVQGQLEQVFLSLLVHAEQSAGGQTEKSVSVEATVVGGKVAIEIAYPLAPDAPADGLLAEEHAFAAGTLGLAVCRGILRHSEGEIRHTADPPTGRFEVTLPLAAETGEEAGAGEAGAPVRPLTLLAVEPDGGAARRLLAFAGAQGHRAVVASSGEQAVPLMEVFPFDAVLCDDRLPGMSWGELFERARGRVRTTVLLTEGYDADLVHRVTRDGGLVLSKPVAPAELARALRAIAARADVE